MGPECSGRGTTSDPISEKVTVIRLLKWAAITTCTMLVWACSERSVTGAGLAPGQGQLAATLTDAPVPFDSVKEVNIFVDRIDARRAHADSADADGDLDGHHDDDHMRDPADSTEWVTIATPNKTFNILDLSNGITAFLGTAVVDSGNFRAFRIVIDPAQSNIVLKDGTVLTASSGIDFVSTHRHGILVELNDTVNVQPRLHRHRHPRLPSRPDARAERPRCA